MMLNCVDKIGIVLTQIRWPPQKPGDLDQHCIFSLRYIQGCGNTMPDLSDLVPFHSGQVENLNFLVLGQMQNLY